MHKLQGTVPRAFSGFILNVFAQLKLFWFSFDLNVASILRIVHKILRNSVSILSTLEECMVLLFVP